MVNVDVLVTGGTGYMGRTLIPELVARGHRVRALARRESMGRVPASAEAVEGDVLDAESVLNALWPGDTVVHLVGTPHPSPAKAKDFIRIDLGSIRAVVSAASRAGIGHLVYVSVANPAPVMKAYIEARLEGERLIAESRLTATIIRPWYVLGPGHRWPIALIPLYAAARLVPPLRGGAERLGLVTLDEMVSALANVVDDPPPAGTRRTLDVRAIRRSQQRRRSFAAS